MDETDYISSCFIETPDLTNALDKAMDAYYFDDDDHRKEGDKWMADVYNLYPSAMKDCTKILPEFSEIFSRFARIQADSNWEYFLNNIHLSNKIRIDNLVWSSGYSYNASPFHAGGYYAQQNKMYLYYAPELNVQSANL